MWVLSRVGGNGGFGRFTDHRAGFVSGKRLERGFFLLTGQCLLWSGEDALDFAGMRSMSVVGFAWEE